MAVYTYDPKNVVQILGGKILRGFTDGEFVRIERNEDMFSLKVGCDGIGTRSKSQNKSAKITITLHQSSDMNDYLSSLVISDERANAGVVPYLMRESNGTTLCSALTVWVPKMAAISYGKEVAERQWTLETDKIEILNGGLAVG